MTNRSIFCLAVSFAAGLLAGREQNIWLCLLPLLCFLLARLLCLNKEQGKKTVPVAVLHMLICMILFFVGAYRYEKQEQDFETVRQFAETQENIQVQGEIYQTEQKQSQFIYYLKDTRILAGNQWYSCGKVQVYSSKDSYQIGNCIQAVGRYEAFQLPRNEGNFNEEQYYYSKKIMLRIRAFREKILDNRKDRYRMWLSKLRSEMEQVFLEYMPQRSAGIMANMTLGSKNLADQEVKALYQKAGISHVLAISGLHVSIFGMGLYRLLRRLYCPKTAACALSTGVVYSFGMLTGMELSTIRAVIMFFLMMTAGALGYTYDTVTALSVSALFQLWENPFALWYAGFLLSYTAVLGAVVIAGLVQRKGEKRGKRKGIEKILDTVYTSLCIQMASLPVLLYFYYEIAAYSVLINGCVLPFMGILLFLGAAGGISGLFQWKTTGLILKLPTWILAGCEGLCSFFTGLPGSSVITGRPSLEKIILYYSLLGIVLYVVSRRQKRRYFFVWTALAVFLCCGNYQKRAEVDFLDVGQGDGIFLQSEKGNGVFIDGGSTDVGKVGTYRILPFLKCRGIKEIQLWFVSHADNDHISGLKEVLESGYIVRNLVFSDGIVKDEAWEELAELAENSGSKIYYLKAGGSITMDTITFTALYPWEEGSDRNQSSMVLFTEIDGMTGIFSGDLGEAQERELVKNSTYQNYFAELVTFYKAAHHGSNTSNSQEILEMILPELTVVSCGKNNSYGHPGREAVKRMEEIGSKVFYTMENGQITIFRSDGKTYIGKFQN